MSLHVRRLKPSDTDRYGRRITFEQLPHAAIDELPFPASGLLLYLLRTGPAFTGRIRDLYRVKGVGLGKDALEAAAGVLQARGYLGHVDQRDARGRLHRVLVVTAVPGEFPDVSKFAAVSIRSRPLTSRNAESSQVGPRPEYQASVRPAETGIHAGGTEDDLSGLGATSRNGAFSQVGPRTGIPASVRPAEMIDWSDIAPAQEGVASRPRAGHTPTTTHTENSSTVVNPGSPGAGEVEEEAITTSHRIAYELLEGLDELAVRQGAEGVIPIAAMLASRIRSGHSPVYLRQRLNRAAPPQVGSVLGLLRARIDEIPIDPRRVPHASRPADVRVDQLQDEIGGGLYARTGERPGFVPPSLGRQRIRQAMAEPTRGVVDDEA